MDTGPYLVPQAVFVPICLGVGALVLGVAGHPWWFLALPFVLLGAYCAAPNFNLADGFLALIAVVIGALLSYFHTQAGVAVMLGTSTSWLLSSLEKGMRAVPVRETQREKHMHKGNAGDDQDEFDEVGNDEFGDEEVDEAALAKFRADMEQALKESFEAFHNRTIYSQLDVATLQAIEDDDLDQAIADYVAIKLEGANTPQLEAAVIQALPVGIRAAYLSSVVEGQVNNGGFNQYYFNTDGLFATDAVAAFEYFGASQLADLMREANAVRAEEAQHMRQFKDRATLEAFSESYQHTKLAPLDDRFYELTEEFAALRLARMRQRPEDFVGD